MWILLHDVTEITLIESNYPLAIWKVWSKTYVHLTIKLQNQENQISLCHWFRTSIKVTSHPHTIK